MRWEALALLATGLAAISLAVPPPDGPLTGDLSNIDFIGTPIQTEPGENQPPVAVHRKYLTDLETVVGIVLEGTDSDGDDLTFSILEEPRKGTLQGELPCLTYTPNGLGEDSFTFKVNDGEFNSNIAMVVVGVRSTGSTPQPGPPPFPEPTELGPGNRPPVAVDGLYRIEKNGTLKLLLGATDPDDNALTFSILDGPSKGYLPKSLSVYCWWQDEPPRVTYLPNVDFVGVDTFTFKANDGELDSNVATITIGVGVNPD